MGRPLLVCALLALVWNVHGADEQIPAEAAPKPPTRATFSERVFGPSAGKQPPKLNPPAVFNPIVPPRWPLFARGHLPAGRTVNESDALHLSSGDYAGETTYLTGNFVVTASGANLAVLRFSAALPSVRIRAGYSVPAAMPAQGARLTVDEQNAFLITRVRRTADDVLTVYVREITAPAAAAK
jgi:hypothetical protein